MLKVPNRKIPIKSLHCKRTNATNATKFRYWKANLEAFISKIYIGPWKLFYVGFNNVARKTGGSSGPESMKRSCIALCDAKPPVLQALLMKLLPLTLTLIRIDNILCYCNCMYKVTEWMINSARCTNLVSLHKITEKYDFESWHLYAHVIYFHSKYSIITEHNEGSKRGLSLPPISGEDKGSNECKKHNGSQTKLPKINTEQRNNSVMNSCWQVGRSEIGYREWYIFWP